MSAPQLRAVSCPGCGARLPARAAGFIDCGACGSPVAVYAPGLPPRRAVQPRVPAEQALHEARRRWQHPLVPEAFARSRAEPPRLLFVACYQAERTFVARASGPQLPVETLERAVAVRQPELPLEHLDLAALGEADASAAFDPAALQRVGLLLDPVRRVDEVLPVHTRLTVLEQHVEVVYLPVWLVRRRFRRDAYDVVVDGSTGAVLRGRAPVRRAARLPQAIAALYLLAPIGALAAGSSDEVALRLLQAPFLFLVLGAAAAALVSWSWDRVRFRYDLVFEGEAERLEALNRPDRTLPERARDFLLRLMRAARPAAQP